MMESNNYTLSKEAHTRMLLHNRWIRFEAPRRGLRDPWKHKLDRPINEEQVVAIIEGKPVSATKLIYAQAQDKEIAAWKVERDEYMRQRDEWIALQMFQRYGYETFLEECRMYNLSEDFQRSVLPCESQGEAQCSMFCPCWNTCANKLK